jgi:hypothetical protein
LKEQNTTAERLTLRRVSHQSVVLKPKAQFDNMLETLAWEHDINLPGSKVLSASSQNLNLGSTQNTHELSSPTPPPPQFITNEYPMPSSIPQRLIGDHPPARRSDFAEIRARPSFIDYEDFDIFRRQRPMSIVQSSTRRISMMPVDADGYKDLLLDIDHFHEQRSKKKNNTSFASRGASTTSNKSKFTDTSIC